MLIPPLLTIAALPAVDKYHPSVEFLPSSNLILATLAALILSLMSKQGPSGLLLAYVRQYFENHPESLRFLARSSLDNLTLLTPTITPKEKENYEPWPLLNN